MNFKNLLIPAIGLLLFSFGAYADIEEPRLHAYPNPANETLYIHFPTGTLGMAGVEIFDLLGNKVLDGSMSVGIEAATQVLHINRLPAGYYIIRVSIADDESIGRFVKQ